MAGWLEIKNEETGYYRSAKPEKTEWPPKFWKFVLQMEEEPENEVAFVDARRLARIRLVDAAAEDMRKTTPLKENVFVDLLDTYQPQLITTHRAPTLSWTNPS